MDFVVQLPVTRKGFDAIVVFVDRLTKRSIFCPTNTTITAPEVAKIFFKHVFCHHGLPKVIVSDRDAKFTSHFWRTLFKQLGTKLSMSTAFHPQTDGQTERMNRTMEEMLRAYVSYNQDNWDEYLPAVEFAYNNSKQLSTGHTPFELDCDQHPLTSASLINQRTLVPADDNFLEHWDNMISIAKDSLREAQERQTEYANQHRCHLIFKIGDKVLLSVQHINNPIDRQRPTRKLTLRYLELYTISAVISPTAYKLNLPTTLRIHPVFHISLLKLYNESEDFLRATPPPPVLTNNNEMEYELETILDKRTLNGSTQYLVKWIGYPLHDATWEPLTNLQNAQGKLNDFLMRTSNS